MSGAVSRPLRILISAVEPSGDILGAALIKALKAKVANAQFFGCGGPAMAKEGVQSLFEIAPFSVVGPVGALRAAPAAIRGAERLARAAASQRADAAVLIDSWSFSRLAAIKIRRSTPAAKIFKYVAPQVWASRPGRANLAAQLFDGVLTLFEFENPYFERAGAPVRYVGSPVFQQANDRKADGAAFRERHGLGASPVLAMLPGSRRGEVRRLAGPYEKTARLLIEDIPQLRLATPAAPAVGDEVRRLASRWPGKPIVVEAEERFDLFAAADAALAASGTVTTELAISRTPMAVAYKVGPLTALWIRSVITTPFVSLLNIAADREAVPEFLQENCRPEVMAAALAPLIRGDAARQAQLEAFPPLLAQLGVGGPPADVRAAAAILDWIGRN